METETSYLIVVPLKDPAGNRAGLVAIPRKSDGTTELSQAVLLNASDAENGAAIAAMLTAPVT